MHTHSDKWSSSIPPRQASEAESITDGGTSCPQSESAIPNHPSDCHNNDPIQTLMFSQPFYDGCVDALVVKDKGRLRTVPFSNVDIETSAIRHRISAVINRRNAHLSANDVFGTVIECRPWQDTTAAKLLLGRDTMVVTATGGGKTMFFFMPLLVDTTVSVLVISPLLALMDDQVSSPPIAVDIMMNSCRCIQVFAAHSLGLTAVQVNDRTINEIPDLIGKLQRCEYRVVFTLPEFSQTGNSHWRKLTALNSSFLKKPVIVIDEAHLIHQWRSFRERYTQLGGLRHSFSGVPFLMCSATMTPYIRQFVHRSLHLNPLVSFIQRSVDRSNVFVSIHQITCKTLDHRQLYFLVPSGVEHPAQIPQTVVFIDSRPDAKQAFDEFWALVPPEWKAIREFKYIFAECSMILTQKRRWIVINAFSKGLCRILFATEVAGMGIGFPSIERVVQWRLGPTLSISSIMQRLGRASRRQGTQGVFLLFYTQQHRLTKKSDKALGIYRTDGASGLSRHVDACIAGVDAWTNGTEKSLPPLDPLDAPVIPSDCYPTEDEDHADMIAMGCRDDSGPTDCWLGQDLSDDESDRYNSDYPPVANEPGSEESETDSVVSLDDNATEGRYGRHTRYNSYPICCRGITWLVNTQQCRLIVLLRLFDDTGLQPASYVVSQHTHQRPTCCNTHLVAYLTKFHVADSSKLPDAVKAIQRLLPPPTPVKSTQPSDLPMTNPRELDGNLVNRPTTDRGYKLAVRQLLRELRLDLWEEATAGDVFMPYAPNKLLPDMYIESLVKQCDSIYHAGTLEEKTAIVAKTVQHSLFPGSATRIASAIQTIRTATPVLLLSDQLAALVRVALHSFHTSFWIPQLILTTPLWHLNLKTSRQLVRLTKKSKIG